MKGASKPQTKKESEELLNLVYYKLYELYEDDNTGGSIILPSLKADIKDLGKRVKDVAGTTKQGFTKNKGSVKKAINTEVKQHGKTTGIPRGIFKGIAVKIEDAADKIDDFVDQWYYKNKYKYELKIYAKIVEKLGGPSAPEDGFKGLANVWNFSSTIVDPSPLGGTFWNDKKNIKFNVLHYGTKTIIKRLLLPGLSMFESFLLFMKKLDVTNNIIDLLQKGKK